MNKEFFENRLHMVYSPFREMIASLHVLTNPSHHLKRKKWADNIREQFSEEMEEVFKYFTSITNQWFNFLDLVDYLEIREKHVEEGIERLARLEATTFLKFLLGERYGIDEENRTPSEMRVFERVDLVKRELADFLYYYHSKFFARELFRVEPWLVKAIHELREQFLEDPIQALDDIHPRFEVSQNSIAFYKAQTYRYQVKELASLTIYPSTFIAPHLLVGLEVPNLIVYLHVHLPDEKNDDDLVPDDLLITLKALADPTRLKLARKLLYHSYCTQQLVEEFQLAKATISKHLKLLEKAKVINSVRQGHYVFYQTSEERLSMLRVDLDQFFDQPLLQKEE